MTGKLNTILSTTTAAGLNLPHGVAPTAPVNGDLWSTTTGIFARINGGTVGPFGTGMGNGSVTSIIATAPLTGGTITTTGSIGILQANGTTNGYLGSGDWTTFNTKENVLSFTSPLVRTTNTISIPASTSSTAGFLTGTDWTTFNNKLSTSLTSGNIFVGNSSNSATGMALSGDATLANTGVMTLASSGVTAAQYGNSTGTIPVVTIDGKGRITVASTRTIGVNDIPNNIIASNYLPLAGGTMTGDLNTMASSIATAGFSLPPGVAPTAPVNGDLWSTTTGIFARINGGTVGPFGTGTGNGSVTSITATSPLTGGTITTTGTIGIPQANVSTNGYLTSTDWSTFSGKLTSTLNNGSIFIGNGSNVAAGVPLSGDATLINTGALTLVNTGVTASIYGNTVGTVPSFTVDAKGRVTAASNRTLVDNDIPDNITASNYLPLVGGTLTGKLNTVLSTTTSAGLNLPHGVAPTTPVNGDLWTTTAGLWARINGTTMGPIFSTNPNEYDQNGNSFGVIGNLGTNDNYALAFKTYNAERMRIDATGNVGIANNNPAYPLDVAGNVNINTPSASSTLTIDAKSSQTNIAKIIFKNTIGTGDFQITGDGQDIFWQGGGGRTLQMGAYHGIDLIGGRNANTALAYTAGSGATYNTRIFNSNNSIGLIIQGVSGQTSNLQEWRNTTGTVLSSVTSAGELNTLAASATTAGLNLPHGVAPTTPVNGDIWTTTSGIYSRINGTTIGPLTSVTTGFLQNGNSFGGTATLGTNDNNVLAFETNGTEKMRISAIGDVAIGSTTFDPTNPEQLLVNAGTTTSVNAIYAKGTINNYFQTNIQNLSTGTQASSDVVATANNGTETTNFVDLGINGSGFVYQAGNPIETGKANDCYLLASGNDFVIANNNAAKDMIFVTGGTATTNERMRILSGGNVGIATTAPAAKLDVNGSFKLGANCPVLGGIIKTSVSVTDNTAFTYTTSRNETVTVTGAAVNATVIVNPRTALPTRIGVGYCYVSAANTVIINITNTYSTSTALGTVVFDVTIIQ
jgi:hypothetical protein